MFHDNKSADPTDLHVLSPLKLGIGGLLLDVAKRLKKDHAVASAQAGNDEAQKAALAGLRKRVTPRFGHLRITAAILT